MSENDITLGERKEDNTSQGSKHNEVRRSAFQKSVDQKPTSSSKTEEKTAKTCFEISKQSRIPPFEKWKNYYVEYWNVFKKNEVVLAKIKETSLEINCMKAHLEELKSLQNKRNNSSY